MHNYDTRNILMTMAANTTTTTTTPWSKHNTHATLLLTFTTNSTHTRASNPQEKNKANKTKQQSRFLLYPPCPRDDKIHTNKQTNKQKLDSHNSDDESFPSS